LTSGRLSQLRDNVSRFIKHCPNCGGERPADEIMCGGLKADEQCGWSLFDVVPSSPGARTAPAPPLPQPTTAPRCRMGMKCRRAIYCAAGVRKYLPSERNRATNGTRGMTPVRAHRNRRVRVMTHLKMRIFAPSINGRSSEPCPPHPARDDMKRARTYSNPHC